VSDLLRAIIDLFRAVWPFRIVQTGQRGAVYLFGRYQGWVSPGCYPFLPFFSDVVPVMVVPEPWPTPLLNISLRDGTMLTFSAMVTLRVEDVGKAMNSVVDWSESCLERVAGVLSESLADADPKRFDPGSGRRDRLVEEIRQAADVKTGEFGVRVVEITFPNFALGVRSFRLISDRATFTEARIGVL
jgi:regulator of protease activity HflC (stomatin/prohibitin superfamily)